VQHELIEIDLFRDLDQDKPLLESLSKDELRTIYREANSTRRWDAYVHGEPRDEFRARIISAIDQIAADHHGERVVVACHGGVITTYLSHLFDSPYDMVVSPHHTSITTVRAMGDLRRVITVNDYQHVLAFQDEINPLNVT
jgi:probable phosphoglycerate mutase